MLILTFMALLAAVGLSHLVVDGSILAKWRGRMIKKYKEEKPWVLELITCYQCTGFWAGFITGLILQPIPWFTYLWWWVALPLHLIVTPFVFGFAASYLSMVGAALLNYLDAPAMMANAIKKNEQSKA
jgi:hypothetical protein